MSAQGTNWIALPPSVVFGQINVWLPGTEFFGIAIPTVKLELPPKVVLSRKRLLQPVSVYQWTTHKS